MRRVFLVILKQLSYRKGTRAGYTEARGVLFIPLQKHECKMWGVKSAQRDSNGLRRFCRLSLLGVATGVLQLENKVVLGKVITCVVSVEHRQGVKNIIPSWRRNYNYNTLNYWYSSCATYSGVLGSNPLTLKGS